MEKKAGGAFGKFLNFIGLVDNQPDEDYSRERRAPQRMPARESARPRQETRDEFDRPYSSSQRQGTRREPERPDTRDDFERPYSSSQRQSARREPERYEREPARHEREPARDYGTSARPRPDARRDSEYRARSANTSTRGEPARSRPADDEDFWRADPPQPSTPPARENALTRIDRDSSLSPHQMMIFRLQSLDECRDVILALIDMKSVTLSLDQLEEPLVQRAVDALGGAVFAIGAAMRKISDRTYLIAPSNVMVQNAGVDQYGSSTRRYY